MEISLKWVNELINLENLKLEKLVEKLTLGGFEVEEIKEIESNNEKQTILDISTTANRADSLSLQGISIEIATLLNQPLNTCAYCTNKVNWSAQFHNHMQFSSNQTNCQVFVAITINNIEDVTSPKWLKRKLRESGRIPENTLHDFQTYIQLETGYPFEMYDLERIFTKTNSNSEFDLALGTKGNLKKVFVNNVPVGLAGIICEDDFKYSSDTQKILLEGSIFKSSFVRQHVRQAELKTERSTRYEKSLKNSTLIEACYRLISLLRIKNPNLQCKLHTNSKINDASPLQIQLTYQTIQNILGPINSLPFNANEYISPKLVTDYLKRLRFNSHYNASEQTWSVSIPELRRDDLTTEIDLIEEIGRLHGFDNFLTRLPKIHRIGIEDISYRTRKKLTQGFLSMGLTESIRYSLVNLNSSLGNSVKLINPLVSEYAVLRSSLLPNLIQITAQNKKQGQLFLNGFEYGHVFFQNSSSLLIEKEMVAGIFGDLDVRQTWETPTRPTNWFEAKGEVEHFFEKINLDVSWKPDNSSLSNSILHDFRTSKLFLNKDLEFGVFGQINPLLAKKLSLPVETYLFEFDFEIIKKFIGAVQLPIFENYSPYPKILKDLSILVPNHIRFEKVKTSLFLNGTALLKKICLIDQYCGSTIPNGYTSLCVQLIFQSNHRTLENLQVEEILQNLLFILKNEFDIQVRD